MKDVIVSVIVPVYNAEKTIHRCVHSIVYQTLIAWELLLVDDGSTDMSGAMCREYEAFDERIRYIFKTNGGVSSARNRGIDEAKGEWITFIDSDDWIEPDALENLYRAAKQYKAEMVLPRCVGEYYSAGGLFERQVFDQDDFELVFNNKQLPKEFGKLWNASCCFSVCGRLFGLDLIKCNKFRFNEKVHVLEDMCFALQSMSHANTIAHIKKIVYHYTIVNVEAYATKRDPLSILHGMPEVQRSFISFLMKQQIYDDNRYIDFLINYWVLGMELLMDSRTDNRTRTIEIINCIKNVSIDALYERCSKEKLQRHYQVLFQTKNVFLFYIIRQLKIMRSAILKI